MAPRLKSATSAAARRARVLARSALRLALTLVNNLTVIPSYCLWLLLLQPLRLLGRCGGGALYWRAEGVLYGWMQAVMASWGWSAGYTLAEWGDDISAICGGEDGEDGEDGGRGGGALVLVNHQATGDIPVLLTALLAKGTVVRRTTWLMDHVFRYTNFGVPSALHGDFFIRQGRAHRSKQLRKLARHLEGRRRGDNAGGDRWIVLFPEGGFLRKRRATSQQFARKNGLPHLTHVTLPRTGATQVILKTLATGRDEDEEPSSSSRLRWVVDVTIAYPRGRPMDIQTWVLGHRKPTVIHLHYRVFPAHQVPTDTEPLTAWLYQRFVEKDRLLAHFYDTGAFPSAAEVAREETLALDPDWPMLDAQDGPDIPDQPGPRFDTLDRTRLDAPDRPRPVTLDSTWLLQIHLLALVSGCMWFLVLRYLCGLVAGAMFAPSVDDDCSDSWWPHCAQLHLLNLYNDFASNFPGPAVTQG